MAVTTTAVNTNIQSMEVGMMNNRVVESMMAGSMDMSMTSVLEKGGGPRPSLHRTALLHRRI